MSDRRWRARRPIGPERLRQRRERRTRAEALAPASALVPERLRDLLVSCRPSWQRSERASALVKAQQRWAGPRKPECCVDAWQGKCALPRRAQLHCDIGQCTPSVCVCFVWLQACGLDASDCCACMRCVGSAVVASGQRAGLGSARQLYLFGSCQSDQHFAKAQRSLRRARKRATREQRRAAFRVEPTRNSAHPPPLLARIGGSSVRLLLTSFHSNTSITAGATLLHHHGSTASITRR